MALVRNVGRTDRTLRVLAGVLMCAGAFLVRAHPAGAVALAAAGVILTVEGLLGH